MLSLFAEKLAAPNRHHVSTVSKAHHNQNQAKPQHQSIALNNVLQSASPSVGVPLPTGSASNICSNQTIFKAGNAFNLAAKNVSGKLTVQPVSLTFPINQQGLAALTTGKPQSLQQTQQVVQNQAGHALLVATSGVGDDVRVAGKTEIHLQQQISGTSPGNLIS